jgi:hypothetical protein
VTLRNKSLNFDFTPICYWSKPISPPGFNGQPVIMLKNQRFSVIISRKWSIPIMLSLLFFIVCIFLNLLVSWHHKNLSLFLHISPQRIILQKIYFNIFLTTINLPDKNFKYNDLIFISWLHIKNKATQILTLTKHFSKIVSGFL